MIEDKLLKGLEIYTNEVLNKYLGRFWAMNEFVSYDEMLAVNFVIRYL